MAMHEDLDWHDVQALAHVLLLAGCHFRVIGTGGGSIVTFPVGGGDALGRALIEMLAPKLDPPLVSKTVCALVKALAGPGHHKGRSTQEDASQACLCRIVSYAETVHFHFNLHAVKFFVCMNHSSCVFSISKPNVISIGDMPCEVFL